MWIAGIRKGSPAKNGCEIVWLKNSIKDPIQRAVTIVPNPAIAKRASVVPLEIRQSVHPRAIHIRSVQIRMYLNEPRCHLFARISATASYGDTPISAVK